VPPVTPVTPSNKKGGKRRLDQALVERGLVESRSRAQAVIMAGLVFSETRRLDKAGLQVAADLPLELRGQDHPWVSRGGLKLDHAISHFEISVAGLICLDVGASTGGFTDVLLSKGAERVYAIDVGHGQLAWKIRQDERVVVMEKINARYLKAESLGEAPGFVCCDTSFIGLATVLPAALDLAAPGATLAALIKPQFEVGRAEVGKGGIVTDPHLHDRVVAEISDWLADVMAWRVLGTTTSPITGAGGNKEFLIAAQKPLD
jgi:23S rRNA (cytidine1920-2'-O)/16S rRNA (cytidine1409-2'-O)-methyltransferase